MNRKLKTKPDLTMKNSRGRVEALIYIVDTNQYIDLGKPSCMKFPHNPSDKTASIVHVNKSRGMTSATESKVDEASIWEWIQRLMQKGYSLSEVEEVEDNGKK
jgi:hypothetical protein